MDHHGEARQGAARDDTRSELGQVPFGRFREELVEYFRDDELEHRIAEELKALVVEVGALGFVSEAGMSKRLGQKERVAEFVFYPAFQRLHQYSPRCSPLSPLPAPLPGAGKKVG